MSELETFFADDRCRIAFWSNLVFVDAWGDVDVEHMQTIERSYRALLARHPSGIVSAVLLQPSVPVASGEARAESARFVKDLRHALLHVAVVIEDRGLIAQVLRAVVRGLNIVGQGNRMSVHDDAERALAKLAPWVVTSDPDSLSDELGAAARELRALSVRSRDPASHAAI